MAQIGEFSFILAALGVSLGLLGRETQALIVAGAMLSIIVNQPLSWWLRRRADAGAALRAAELQPAGTFDFGGLAGHVVLIGHGRVGGTVLDALDRAGDARLRRPWRTGGDAGSRAAAARRPFPCCAFPPASPT